VPSINSTINNLQGSKKQATEDDNEAMMVAKSAKPVSRQETAVIYLREKGILQSKRKEGTSYVIIIMQPLVVSTCNKQAMMMISVTQLALFFQKYCTLLWINLTTN
jgi:hypothetical protein